MIEFTSVDHHIQKHIIDVLMYSEAARFRDLRPPKVDTNLFTYHLNALVKMGMVMKVEGGYALTAGGLSYVDRVSVEKRVIRTQPKIISMIVVQNEEGDVLLQRRTKQPYINTWTLPYGKLHIEDTSVMDAAKREVKEKLAIDARNLEHAGDCYIRVSVGGEPISTTLAHVFRCYRDDITVTQDLVWARPHKLAQYKLAPAVQEIMTRTFFKDPFYFEEYDIEWTD